MAAADPNTQRRNDRDRPQSRLHSQGQSFVRSDTGELLRDWKQGIQTIDTPKTQAVAGWIGGKTLELGEATIRIDTRKAVVALTSIDDQPLSSSRHILITAMARAIPGKPKLLPYLSEPVVGTITLRTKTDGLQLLALNSHGQVLQRLDPQHTSNGLTIHLPTAQGTHWYALRTSQPSKPETEHSDPNRPPSEETIDLRVAVNSAIRLHLRLNIVQT